MIEISSRRRGRLIEYEIGSMVIRLIPSKKVYMPSAATLLIARNLEELDGAEILDLGTGSGFLAILSSKLGAGKVVATDVSRRALEAARENARLNGADNIDFRLGSVYDPVGSEVFDLIICNPPMTPSRTPLPVYTWGGADGRVILERVVKGAPEHLRKGGRLIMPVISLVGVDRVYALMRRVGLKPRAIDYVTHPFGRTLLRLINYVKALPDADFFYDGLGRPCWRLVLFEALRT